MPWEGYAGRTHRKPGARATLGQPRRAARPVLPRRHVDEWLDARAAAEVPRAATAGRAIAEIPTWPSWSGPFWTQSFRDHYAPLIAAVAAGDEAPVRANMPVNCSWLTAP